MYCCFAGIPKRITKRLLHTRNHTGATFQKYLLPLLAWANIITAGGGEISARTGRINRSGIVKGERKMASQKIKKYKNDKKEKGNEIELTVVGKLD